MVHPVDERHVDVGAPQLARGSQPAEARRRRSRPAAAPAALRRHGRTPCAAVPAPSRSSRWSPTRSALAIAVSAGFTAPMLGKKLVSTT